MPRVLQTDGYITLEEQDDGRLLLIVTCGTVAEYDLRLELTPEEVARYRAAGSSFITEFGGQVMYSPKDYAWRHVS